MRLKVLWVSVVMFIVSNPAIASTNPDEFIADELREKAVASRNFTNPVTFVVTGVANGVGDSVTTELHNQPFAAALGESRGAWQNCLSPSDPECDVTKPGRSGKPGNFDLSGTSVLPVCTSDIEENCIESFEIAYGNNEFTKAKFLRQLQTEYVVKPDSTTDFPGGSSVALWNDSSVKDSKSLSYVTNVSYSVLLNSGNRFDITSVSFDIKAYDEISGNYRAPHFDYAQRQVNNKSFRNTKLVWTENGRAGIHKQFPVDSKYRLKVRTNSRISGWYQGRIKNPNIEIEKFSNRNNVISIEGQPVRVPTFSYTKDASKLSAKEYSWQQNNGGMGTLTGGSGFITLTNSDVGDIFDYLDHFRTLASDKVSGFYSMWSIHSTKWGNNNSCLRDTSRLLGIVSTNAMGYNGYSPQFENGTINYQVAGMHYEPDGKTLVEGTYDLLLRSDAARCLYGFTNAPVQASISITGEQDQKIAVTTMTESKGWMKLSAYGFNFSSPKIQVRLSQVKEEEPKIELQKVESPPVPAQSTQVKSAAAKPQTVVAKKKSITCVKGKLTKKVSGLNPKCPTGFKKK